MNPKKLIGFLLPGILAVFFIANAFGSSTAVQATADDTPTPTPTPGAIAVSLTPAQRALSCSASTLVTVNVTQGGTTVPNGTQVTIASNPGTVAPAILQTQGGAATFTYFAPPAGGGAATISATALGVNATTTISLFCGVGPGGQVQGPTINQPVVSCFGGQANVTFSWSPVAGAEVQYVDLTLANNAFAPGTFIGFGPLSPATTTIQWNGLLPGQTHYWRVSAGVTNAGWVFSQTGSFTPCTPQAPAGGTTFSCTGNGRANVTWNIANVPFGTVATYVDITIFNNGFAPNTFIGSQATGQQNFTWTGILANTPHYWRINHLGPQGWVTGGQGSFTATC